MKLWLATKCLGAVTNIIISQPVKGYYFVSFNTGTVTACPIEVQVVSNSAKDVGYLKVVAEYKVTELAISKYKSFQEVILKLQENK